MVAMGKNSSCVAQCPCSGALILLASMYSSGGQPYQTTPASTSGAMHRLSSVRAPPMQKPVTPTLALRVFRYCTAPRISWEAIAEIQSRHEMVRFFGLDGGLAAVQ